MSRSRKIASRDTRAPPSRQIWVTALSDATPLLPNAPPVLQAQDGTSTPIVSQSVLHPLELHSNNLECGWPTLSRLCGRCGDACLSPSPSNPPNCPNVRHHMSLMLHPLPGLPKSVAWKPTPKCAGGCRAYGGSAPEQLVTLLSCTSAYRCVNSRGTVRNQKLALVALPAHLERVACVQKSKDCSSAFWANSLTIYSGCPTGTPRIFRPCFNGGNETSPLHTKASGFTFCAAAVRASATPGFRPSALCFP